MSIDSDLEAMLAGWDSKPVSIGSWTGTGLLDEMDVLDVDRAGDPVLVRKSVLKVPRAAFVDATGALTVARGDTVTIDGTAVGSLNDLVTAVRRKTPGQSVSITYLRGAEKDVALATLTEWTPAVP